MTDTALPKRIHSSRLFDALRDVGIVRDGDYTRRVVIDVQVGNPVRVYVERFGDERLLSVVQGLDGVEIEWSPETVKG